LHRLDLASQPRLTKPDQVELSKMVTQNGEVFTADGGADEAILGSKIHMTGFPPLSATLVSSGNFLLWLVDQL
jgi:hypothetical protein